MRLSGCLQELKNKGKVQLGNPKSNHSHLRELVITQIKQGFSKLVVTRAGCLREWSQGELFLVTLRRVHSIHRQTIQTVRGFMHDVTPETHI